MLDQIDLLPGSQRQPAAAHRQRKLHRGQHGLDMRGHIVRAFATVPVVRAFWRKFLQHGRKIGQHIGVGILLHAKRSRSVGAKHRKKSGAGALARKETLQLGPYPVEARPARLDAHCAANVTNARAHDYDFSKKIVRF